VMGESPQSHDHLHSLQKRQLLDQPVRTVGCLHCERTVPGRGAFHRTRNPAIPKLQAVTRPGRLGLVGESRPVQRPIEPDPRAVSGEHPTGPVSPVSRRRQSHQHQTGVWVPEPRNRPAPIALIPVSCSLRRGYLFAPGNQPFAASASRQRNSHLLQRCGTVDFSDSEPPIPCHLLQRYAPRTCQSLDGNSSGSCRTGSGTYSTEARKSKKVSDQAPAASK
jgi:hypothetical protein